MSTRRASCWSALVIAVATLLGASGAAAEHAEIAALAILAVGAVLVHRVLPPREGCGRCVCGATTITIARHARPRADGAGCCRHHGRDATDATCCRGDDQDDGDVHGHLASSEAGPAPAPAPAPARRDCGDSCC